MVKESRKILKVFLSFICIIALIMPYCDAVANEVAINIANVSGEAIASNSANEANSVLKSIQDKTPTTIQITDEHKQSASQSEVGYEYKIGNRNPDNTLTGGTNVFKLMEESIGGVNYNEPLFCVKASKRFRNDLNSDQRTYIYQGDLSNSSIATSFKNDIEFSTDAKYKALLKLLDIIYLNHKDSESAKDEFIAEFFANEISDSTLTPPLTVENIKSTLTDNDIEVIEQWAIWKYTDNYDNFPQMAVYSNGQEVDVSEIRQQLAHILYDRLIAKAETNTSELSAPTITPTPKADSELENGYYKFGPIKITSNGRKIKDLKLIDQNKAEISRDRYVIKISEGGTLTETNKNLDELIDRDFYIYIPSSDTTITKANIVGTFREISYWKPAEGSLAQQPIVAFENKEIKLELNIIPEIFDLALRKYIVSVGNKNIDRAPNVDTSKLYTGKIKGNGRINETADYIHSKDPIEVKNGDVIKYRISVYNEGDIPGKVLEITDYLPDGLKLKSYTTGDGSTNDTYKWKSYEKVNQNTSSQNGGELVESPNGKIVKTTFTVGINNPLQPFDGTNLDSEYVEIECIVEDTVAVGRILKNIAEITSATPTDENGTPLNPEVPDRDSTPGNVDEKQEDDDDFENVVVVKDTLYDLALKKFIVQVNNTEITDRVPKVTIPENLGKDDSVHDAIYETKKTPVKVEIGDRVIYTIRVYNEGTQDAKVGLIVDYPKVGLEFIDPGDGPEQSKVNKDNGWHILGPNDDFTPNENWNVENGAYVTNKFKDETINAYNGQTLDYKDVQIEFKVVATQLSENQTLRNIAEIAKDDGDDRDSTPGSLPENEDDDDYDDVIIPGKIFDLSLQKYITKVNGKEETPSREPKVDVSKLRNGQSNDAEYEQVKTPVVVQIGDIITYKIRVYNEGDISGYADLVSDYLPEGLGLILQYKTNTQNNWKVPDNFSNFVKLTDIPNATKNVTIGDFDEDVTSLENVVVAPGRVNITSNKLKYDEYNDSNLLRAFDKENENSTLDYRDIEVACIFLGSTDSTKLNFKNIAEITKDLDKNGNEVTDRDSTPANYDEKPGEDDDDYEIVTLVPKKFDLALRKFITKVDNTDVTSRIPVVAIDDKGNIKYVHPKDPVQTANSQLVTYTIRVFNEGEIDGYATEVKDNIPEGLEFVPSHETNMKYGWTMYDKDGNITTSISNAVEIRTDYLSKEKSQARNDDALIYAFDPSKPISNDPSNPNPHYKDLQVVFKVTESNLNSDRVIINVAQVTKMHDKDGNPVKDEDEDDLIDKEYVKVNYFDLELIKFVKKVVVIEDGVTDEQLSNYDGENDLPGCAVEDKGSPMPKVEVNKRKIDSTIVKFVYTIRVTNTGKIPGYATEITDYIPDGFAFIQEDNKMWDKKSDNEITTNALIKTLLNPGESADVEVTLEWINDDNNFGAKRNIAEITEDYNEFNAKDIDSTPKNKVEAEDDIDDAKVLITVSTGNAPIYFGLIFGVLFVIAGGTIAIRKFLM